LGLENCRTHFCGSPEFPAVFGFSFALMCCAIRLMSSSVEQFDRSIRAEAKPLRKPQQTPNRLELQVGENWPDGITTKIETIPAHEAVLKTGVIIAIIVFCVALIAILAVHAMAIGNEQRVDSILNAAWKVLIGFGLWAISADKVKAVLRKAMHTLKE
jgi:hypothetical protein